MKPDVLFWFYKDFEICRERLRRLRKLNDEINVFALYGGPLTEAKAAEDMLDGLVDDFYIFSEKKDKYWKWRHGDQMISAWYRDRGHQLNWETLFVMQWDMLILDSLENLFSNLKPDEILLSGFTSVDSVSAWWPWASSQDKDFSAFKEMLRTEFNYEDDLFACLFIVACLPRLFLDKYAAIEHSEVGFLEYKIPTMAHVFGIPVCKDPRFDPWWKANPDTMNVPRRQRTLNAVAQKVPFSVILSELASSDGKRLFHPVFTTLPEWMENPYILKLVARLRFLAIVEAIYQLFESLNQQAKRLVKQLLPSTS